MIRLLVCAVIVATLTGCGSYIQHKADYTLFMTDEEWLYWHGLGPEDRDDD